MAGGSSHQRRVFQRSLQHLREKRAASAINAENRLAKCYFLVGLFLGLVNIGLPLTGLAVNLWLGGSILTLAFLSILRAIWMWETSSKLRSLIRAGAVAVAALLCFGTTARQIFSQYRRDHPTGLPMRLTHTSAGIGGRWLDDQFTTGRCREGVPEITKDIQWTWVLRGAHFGCLSNDFNSEGTLDFDHNVLAMAATHATIPTGFANGTVDLALYWYGWSVKGHVKWIISAACVSPPDLDFTLRDVLTILDSPGSDTGHVRVSTGGFSLAGCKPWDVLIIQLSRRGDDKEDTSLAKAQVVRLSINTSGIAVKHSQEPEYLEAEIDQVSGLMQRLVQEIPQGYRYDPEYEAFVPIKRR